MSGRVLPGVGRQDDDKRLYGVPGAEVLHFDIGACYETDIEPWLHERDHAPRVIEEWTCRPVAEHLPPGDWLIDRLLEWVADEGLLDEYGYDAFELACQGEDVMAAAVALRSVIASKVNYRMADKLVAEHSVTWDDADEPLVDGEPLYVAVRASDEQVER
jgi:hypothetical protein